MFRILATAQDFEFRAQLTTGTGNVVLNSKFFGFFTPICQLSGA